MSKMDQAVARRLFHCARAIGHVLEAGGPVPMSPDGFRYEGDTIAYEPPAATSHQLCIAPELARPGASRDMRTTCYEAAMCIRAHIEGADELERLLLDVGPEADRDAEWSAWLEDEKRAVPPPPAADYAGLEAATELLRSWTQREPRERKMKSDGWHALAKAVLEDAPEATQAPDPRRTRSWPPPPEVVRSGLIALGCLVLGVLLGMLLRGAGSPAESRAAPKETGLDGRQAVETLKVLLVRGSGDSAGDVRTVRLTRPHDQVVLRKPQAEAEKLTLKMESGDQKLLELIDERGFVHEKLKQFPEILLVRRVGQGGSPPGVRKDIGRLPNEQAQPEITLYPKKRRDHEAAKETDEGAAHFYAINQERLLLLVARIALEKGRTFDILLEPQP